ncbi:MAG: rhodanese-like domain-containing protein [Campylobacterota bacterium]|nr:rhodanese-like domain-containing protein [Campylobacterota bacterium]
MLKKIVILFTLLFSFSYGDFKGLNPAQLQEMIDKNIVVIDIRTAPEWIETGVVPRSKKMMFFTSTGHYDINGWMEKFSKYVKDKSQPFVLVCRSGNRTGTVGNFLSKKLKYQNVYHLQNGIKSWIYENRKTIK